MSTTTNGVITGGIAAKQSPFPMATFRLLANNFVLLISNVYYNNDVNLVGIRDISILL